MIRSSHWSRYDVARVRPRPRGRLLLLLLLTTMLAILLVLTAGVDWTHMQTLPLLDLAGHRWELYWGPDTATTALWHQDLANEQVTNLIQIRWR